MLLKKASTFTYQPYVKDRKPFERFLDVLEGEYSLQGIRYKNAIPSMGQTSGSISLLINGTAIKESY